MQELQVRVKLGMPGARSCQAGRGYRSGRSGAGRCPAPAAAGDAQHREPGEVDRGAEQGKVAGELELAAAEAHGRNQFRALDGPSGKPDRTSAPKISSAGRRWMAIESLPLAGMIIGPRGVKIAADSGRSKHRYRANINHLPAAPAR